MRHVLIGLCSVFVVAWWWWAWEKHQDHMVSLLEGEEWDRLVADLVASAENTAHHTELDNAELAMRYRQLAARHQTQRYRR